MNEMKLIALDCYLCECYDSDLRWQIQRFSNNSQAQFTDVEVLTIYVFALMEEDKRLISQIHSYAHKYLRSYFPNLPTYAVFVHRLNRLAPCLPLLAQQLRSLCPQRLLRQGVLLVDSMPVVTCSHKRSGKVAPELTGKGVCPSKNLFYFGCKLHCLTDSALGCLPLPAYVELTSGCQHDLTVMRPVIESLSNQTLIGDKIYADGPFNEYLEKTCNSRIFTPVKLIKGECQRLREFDKAANDIFSRWVSQFRQPIESFFNWLQEKTGIQTASKVRSQNGLLVHVFGKLAAAFASLVFIST